MSSSSECSTPSPSSPTNSIGKWGNGSRRSSAPHNPYTTLVSSHKHTHRRASAPGAGAHSTPKVMRGPLGGEDVDCAPPPCYTALALPREAPVSFGCPELDSAFGGGVPRRGLTEVAGEAGAGKTQICLQLCLEAVQESGGGVGGRGGDAGPVATGGKESGSSALDRSNATAGRKRARQSTTTTINSDSSDSSSSSSSSSTTGPCACFLSCGEGIFPSQRLLQMARARAAGGRRQSLSRHVPGETEQENDALEPDGGQGCGAQQEGGGEAAAPLSPEALLGRVHVLHVSSAEHLSEVLSGLLPQFMSSKRGNSPCSSSSTISSSSNGQHQGGGREGGGRGEGVRLVVIDSIGALFRGGGGFGHSRQDMQRRSRMLTELAQQMKQLSDEHACPFVVVNQVTSKPVSGLASDQASGQRVAVGGWGGESRPEPALGLLWSTCVNSRFVLRKTGEVTRGAVGRSGIGGGVMQQLVVQQPVREMALLLSPAQACTSRTFTVSRDGVHGG